MRSKKQVVHRKLMPLDSQYFMLGSEDRNKNNKQLTRNKLTLNTELCHDNLTIFKSEDALTD
jgi:hypothetical protein